MILEHYLIDSGTFRVCLHQALFRCFIYEKRDVTYAADTGQRYILVAHAHRTLGINNMASVCYNICCLLLPKFS